MFLEYENFVYYTIIVPKPLNLGFGVGKLRTRKRQNTTEM